MDSFSLIGIFVIGFMGALTPGPDILLVLRTSLRFGFKSAFIAFLGIVSGWIIFLSAVYFGLGYMLNNIFVYIFISFVGSIYLAYISYKLFNTRLSSEQELGYSNDESQNIVDLTSSKDSEKLDSLIGLYFKALGINLSNPKAFLFFITIIAPFMNIDLGQRLAVLLCSMALPFLGVMLLGGVFKERISPKTFFIIDKICSILFICFSIYLFYTAFRLVKEAFYF